MKAGRMTTRLRILKPRVTKDRFNADITEWESGGMIHAERVRLTSRSRIEASEVFPSAQARFNIRDAHEVGENWRVEEYGGHLYTVSAIEANRKRGMLTLICDRINV